MAQFTFHLKPSLLPPFNLIMGTVTKYKLGCVYSYTNSTVIHNTRTYLTKSMSISCGHIGMRRGDMVSITQPKVKAHKKGTSLPAQEAEGLTTQLWWTSRSEMRLYTRASTSQAWPGGTEGWEESKPHKPAGQSLEHGTLAPSRCQSTGNSLNFGNACITCYVRTAFHTYLVSAF